MAPFERDNEFHEELPLGADADPKAFSRRGFLAALGLSAAAMTAACSRSPKGKVLPPVEKPEDVVAGVPLYYATTCGACSGGCGLVVKTRDGRPIHVAGNTMDAIASGGTCAVGQASVLGLYDADRATAPMKGDQKTTWEALDREVLSGLAAAGAAGKAIYVVTRPDLGPSETAALEIFLAAHKTATHVWLSTDDRAAEAAANAGTFGTAMLARRHLDKASFVLAVEADFLGTWRSPVAYSAAYARARDPKAGKMLVHHQVEPKMTLTGSNADVRWSQSPADTVPLLAALARGVAEKLGKEAPAGVAKVRAPGLSKERVEGLVSSLVGAKDRALVLTGASDPAAHALVNAIHVWLGAAGVTVDLGGGTPWPERAISFEAMEKAIAREGAGAVILWGVNPGYAHADPESLAGLFGRAPLTVSMNDRRDESGQAMMWLAPDCHPLEKWGDLEPARGEIRVRQPVVLPLGDTRPAEVSLLKWAGDKAAETGPETTPGEALVRRAWREKLFPEIANFDAFWDRAVHDGVARATRPALEAGAFRPEGVTALLEGHPDTGAAPTGHVLWLYEKVGLRDGALANNGWLQELPDPISKVTWTNYACVSGALAAALGVAEGSQIEIAVGSRKVTLPVLVEPGVDPTTVAVAIGYGRTAAGKIGNARGKNAWPLSAGLARTTRGVALTKTGSAETNIVFAKTQTEASMHGRDLVRQATLAAFLADPTAGRPHETSHGGDGKKHLSMWSGHEYPGKKWGMTIDLTACTGCSACLVACQAENNVPVVGEDEVRRRREMHWIRIDRYFEGTDDEPSVVHQPMMCLHCDNAPCETVCPVLATVHSEEGLNQQVYNRCVGTRYCANNCPPKVRRFNWFDYPTDPLERMVLNPDVVVRSRGVMEKCSFCVQRISDARGNGGEVKTACQEACPTRAIHFGDVKDPDSDAGGLVYDERRYGALEDLGIGPNVTYLTKIRNRKEGAHHG